MTKEIDANCPECGYRVDDASGVNTDPGQRPEADDLALCIQCAGPGIYFEKENGMLGLRLLTIEEKVELSQDAEAMRVRELIASHSVWFTP